MVVEEKACFRSSNAFIDFDSLLEVELVQDDAVLPLESGLCSSNLILSTKG